MRQFNIAINGVKQVVNCAERWEEVTLGQAFVLEGLSSPLELFNVLTGIDATEASADLEAALYDALDWIANPPDWSALPAPKYLILDGVPYKLPRVQDCMLGQAVMLTQAQAQEQDVRKVMLRVLAIYFQPLFDATKFDHKRLEATEEKLKRVEAVAALAAANFYLTAPTNLARITAIGSVPWLQPILSSSETATNLSATLSSSTT